MGVVSIAGVYDLDTGKEIQGSAYKESYWGGQMPYTAYQEGNLYAKGW